MTAATSITVRVPLKIRRRPGRNTVVTPVLAAGEDAAIATRLDGRERFQEDRLGRVFRRFPAGQPVAAVVVDLVEIAVVEVCKRAQIAVPGLRHKLGVAPFGILRKVRECLGFVPQ